MNYKPEIYEKATAILKKRKRDAELLALSKHSDFVSRCPRALDIERQMQSTGSQAARTVLSGGNVRETLSKLRDINLDLQKEYHELLTQHGFTNEEIEPKFTCEKCKDSGFVDGFICSCHKELLKKISYEELNALTPLEISGFENYSLDYFRDFTPAQRKLMEKNFNFCRHYANTFSTKSDNLLFCGSTGLGKTHLSLAIAKEVIKKGYGVIYGSVQSFAVSIERERFSADTEVSSSLSFCDLLILDDLGTEFPSQYTQSVIYDIINTRIMRNLPTIISTNLSPEELQKRYGERMISRFFGAYNRLQFVGKDIRMIKKFT